MPNYNEDLNITGEVNVTGNSDAAQLVVQGHSTQTNPLQQWQSNAAVPMARVTGDGRFQVGSFSSGEMATDDSLIEAHRAETDTAKPKRGFHLMGAITGTLSTAVSWVVQELTLKGTSGVAALHTALRVRLRNEATGAPAVGGELRGGDIEVTHAGGAGGSPIPTVTGLRVTVNQETGATSTALHGLKVEVPAAASGIYALHTTGGKVHLGGLSAGVLSVDANGDVISGAGNVNDYIFLEHRLTNNTHGGTATAGSWETRPINLEVIDTANICSLSSNVITLPAGTYEFHITTSHHATTRTAIRLYNSTASQVIKQSVNLNLQFVSGSVTATGIIVLEGQFVLATQSDLRIQQRVSVTQATSGMGIAKNFGVGEDEIYLQAVFRRIAL